MDNITEFEVSTRSKLFLSKKGFIDFSKILNPELPTILFEYMFDLIINDGRDTIFNTALFYFIYGWDVVEGALLEVTDKHAVTHNYMIYKVEMNDEGQGQKILLKRM